MNAFKIINGGVNSRPHISIAIRTYNHQKFIGQAIESVLMQNTSYSYEIAVADDCSPDNTRNVILEYQKKYPEKIKLILQEKNVGHNKNQITLLTNLSGKYVALLDGDDYWTDPLKLQKQVDFLENNGDFASCFHNVSVLKEGQFQNDNMIEVKDVTTIYDLARNNYIRISSFTFRNNLVKDFPEEIETVSGDDYFHFMLVSKYGKIRKMREIMAVYRRHDDSMSSAMAGLSMFKNTIRNVEVLFPHFDDDIAQILKEQHVEKIFHFAIFLVNYGLIEGKGFLFKSMNANMDTVLIRIVALIQDNIILKGQQKSLKFTFKNIFNLSKRRFTN